MRQKQLFALAVALVAVALTVALGPSSARELPVRTYGPAGGRFQASFATTPQRSGGLLVEEGEQFLQMHPLAVAYVASLGASSREDVEVAVYPHAPSATELRRYLGRLRTPGVVLGTWYGLPAEGYDVACREGDSPIMCPGRIADELIVDHSVVYEVRLEQVTEAEVRRFFAAFRPG